MQIKLYFRFRMLLGRYPFEMTDGSVLKTIFETRGTVVVWSQFLMTARITLEGMDPTSRMGYKIALESQFLKQQWIKKTCTLSDADCNGEKILKSWWKVTVKMVVKYKSFCLVLKLESCLVPLPSLLTSRKCFLMKIKFSK